MAEIVGWRRKRTASRVQLGPRGTVQALMGCLGKRNEKIGPKLDRYPEQIRERLSPNTPDLQVIDEIEETGFEPATAQLPAGHNQRQRRGQLLTP